MSISFLLSTSPASASRNKSKGLSDSQIEILRKYISDEHCICDKGGDTHTSDCNMKRDAILKSREFKSVSKILSSLFCISEGNNSMNIIDLRDKRSTGLNANETPLDQEECFEECEHSERSSEEKSKSPWYATLQLEVQRHTGSSIIEKVLDALLYLLIHPTAYAYLVQPTATNSYVGSSVETSSPNYRTAGKHCIELSYSSIRLHEDVSSNLEDFASCLHHGVRLEDFPSQNCSEKVQESHDKLPTFNPPLSALCGSFLQGYITDLSVLREVASAFAVIIDDHIDHAEEYLDRLDQAITPEASMYWSKYGSGGISALMEVTQKTEETAICFPGRRMYRPSISFEGMEVQGCSKTILRTDTHSDGILTVQCVCSNPKLLGFVVMKKPESTEVALDSILTHFRIPPRVIFYDNACNLYASALLRVPWLLNQTRFLVDRFHYKSHTCSTFFDPSSYRELDLFKTTGEESINARIEKVLCFLRYLRGKNYVPFLRARFALLNLGSIIREETGKPDLEDVSLWRKFQNYFDCECALCTRHNSASVDN